MSVKVDKLGVGKFEEQLDALSGKVIRSVTEMLDVARRMEERLAKIKEIIEWTTEVTEAYTELRIKAKGPLQKSS